MRTCTKCGIKKDLALFYKDVQKSSGHSPLCKFCKNKENKKWGIRNPSKINAIKEKWLFKNQGYRQVVSLRSHLKRKYSLTVEEFNAMQDKQSGLCLICDRADTNVKRLSVDHDHRTGAVRGLICRKCNSILGLAHDDILTLENCISYLKSFDDVHACALADKNLIVKMK